MRELIFIWKVTRVEDEDSISLVYIIELDEEHPNANTYL